MLLLYVSRHYFWMYCQLGIGLNIFKPRLFACQRRPPSYPSVSNGSPSKLTNVVWSLPTFRIISEDYCAEPGFWTTCRSYLLYHCTSVIFLCNWTGRGFINFPLPCISYITGVCIHSWYHKWGNLTFILSCSSFLAVKAFYMGCRLIGAR